MRMRGMVAGAALLGLAACGGLGAGLGTPINTHTVTLRDAAGRTVGTALLTPAPQGVQVVLSASGIPAGEHGAHIHANGDCTVRAAGDTVDFQRAGGHFNPTQKQHGFENPNGYHAGDLRNLTVGADGRGTLNGVATGVTLDAGPANSLRKSGGTALVVHATADDYRTDPSGRSGARIACGVISPG